MRNFISKCRKVVLVLAQFLPQVGIVLFDYLHLIYQLLHLGLELLDVGPHIVLVCEDANIFDTNTVASIGTT